MASTLQADHALATRHRIVMACVDLLVTENPAALSMPAVAERAGVSVRTVYRYFPTKEDLVTAASEQTAEPTRAILGQPVELDNFREVLTASWHVLTENRSLLIAAQRTPEGVAARRGRAKARRRELATAIQRAGIELDAAREQKLVDLIALVTGSMAMFELTDMLDHELDEAVEMSAWAVDALIAHVRRTKGDDL
jgi:AcrR family transcriptional regulator